ncbi:MAG: glycerophosphodiester phosphodiesterase [bacterium]|nr:glycerophosphodiester phosphodiesterase [bacterium]
MFLQKVMFTVTMSFVVCLAFSTMALAEDKAVAQIGPRPFYVIADMDESALKTELQQCSDGPFYRTDFSIGHRGACMQFPEHTKESYEAAARMGAGIVECDVTFTKDQELVCRHSQCDLHKTTNILTIPELAAKCSQPFTPAEIDPNNGDVLKKASAKCCASDITLDEFKMLKGKMDAANSGATTVEEYLNATANWRTDLYDARGTLMTHAESIELFKQLGAKMTPELKAPKVDMPFNGEYTQEAYAQQMIEEYKAAGVDPSDVFAQSFNLDDVVYWLKNEPEFGKQAVYLDGRYNDETFDHIKPDTWSPNMDELVAAGVKIIAPPMWMLVALNEDGVIVPSVYTEHAKTAGLEIITWTFERSDFRDGGDGDWYYRTTGTALDNEGDKMEVLDVLAQEVGVLGIFSDWPATVSYYASCKGLK